jgi:HK97 family phage major capsid protein
MSHLKELREKSAKIAMQARELLADETKTAEVDAMLAEHDAIEARIAQEQRVAAAEAKINEADSRRPIESRAGTVTHDRTDNYNNAFDRFVRTQFESEISSETRAILRNGMETRDGQIAGSQGAGGYLVPTLLADQIVVAQKFYNALRSDNTSWFTTSTGAALTIPQRDSTGYAAKIPGESNAAIVNAITYTDVVLNSYTIKSDIYKASWELLQDASFDVGADIAEHMGESVGRKLNTLLTTGAGAGSQQPTGIVTAVGTPSLATASNSTVSIDDFLALEAAVDIAYRTNPKTAYMFNDTTRLAIRKLKDTTGRYYWQPAVTLGDQATFNGYNYIINNDMVSQATNAVFAVFGDFSKFRVRNVQGMFMTRLNELYAANGQVGFLMTQRVDSLLVDTRAVKGIKGS